MGVHLRSKNFLVETEDDGKEGRRAEGRRAEGRRMEGRRAEGRRTEYIPPRRDTPASGEYPPEPKPDEYVPPAPASREYPPEPKPDEYVPPAPVYTPEEPPY